MVDKKEKEHYQQEEIYQEIIIKFKEGTSQEDMENFFVMQNSEKEDASQKGTENSFEMQKPELDLDFEARPSFDADPDLLDSVQKEAARNLGRPVPGLRFFWRMRLAESLDPSELDDLIKRLADDDKVEDTALAALPGPPPSPPNYVGQGPDKQGYLKEPSGTPPTTQGGVGAECAWNSGYKGFGVRVCDCEYGYMIPRPNKPPIAHNDLPPITVISNLDQDLTQKHDHGTSVLGILAGLDDGVGVTGICHEAEMLFASESGDHRLDCLNDLIEATKSGGLESGDVILLEMQTEPPCKPAEYNKDVHAAVTTLVGLNMVVVAAAGNDDLNLDNETAPRNNIDKYIWQKGHPDYDDSGAILVGAGHAPTNSPHIPHSKVPSSAYGSRVDCQGWGNKVVTAGTGDLYSTQGAGYYYTRSFGLTSSAAAIVTGVVACLQGYAKQQGKPLRPSFIRHLLRQNAYGSPQQYEPGQSQNIRIGPLPDLCRLIPAAHLRPDVYMRDHVSDTGIEPSAVLSLCFSPDIIVRQTLSSTPGVDYGGVHWGEDDLGEDVKTGQDNYIYVRLHNRGDLLDDVTIHIYWAEPSAFLHPGDWNLIGELEADDVLLDEHRVVGPLTWAEDDIPGAGHYCLIGVVSSEVDFVPIPDEFSTVTEYLAFVRRHNNICYRNVEVVDLISGEPCSSSFLLRGLPDRADTFRLEVNHWLPAGARVLAEVMQMRQELEQTVPIEESPPVHYPPHIMFEPLTEHPPLVFSDLHLEKESAELVRVQITLPDDAPPGVYLIYADQYLGETQLGRVNYVLQVSE